MPVRSENRPQSPRGANSMMTMASSAEHQQVPGAVVGKRVLQEEEDDDAEDRPFDRADAADDDDEDDIGRPVDHREGGIRRDAPLLEIDERAGEAGEEGRGEIDQGLHPRVHRRRRRAPPSRCRGRPQAPSPCRERSSR